MMISKIGALNAPIRKQGVSVQGFSAAKNKGVTQGISDKNYSQALLVGALQGYNSITPAKTISFGQQSLSEVFEELNQTMFTCANPELNKKGEEVGNHISASELINLFSEQLPKYEDAIKTNVEVSVDKKNGTFVEARTQIKKTDKGILYEMAVRQPRKIGTIADKTLPLTQRIMITQDNESNEAAYVLNTKGKLISVVEDGDNVLLTNSGNIKTNGKGTGFLQVSVETRGSEFHPFSPAPQEVKERHFEPSEGEGTEIVIGMEQDRFVPQIIASLETFCEKINNGEIILDKFVAAPDAKKIQLSMLAGGYGSRAEYTNASSDRIFHNDPNGAQSTKGVFRTATGLTPMETTFITLHKAGLLDCSKGKIGINKNIKLYLNESGINKGNGGFTVDMYNKMEREGRDYLAIFPNDSMSRMTDATIRMSEIMRSGNAAMAMIAKEVKSEDAIKTFGIMKLGENNEILDFAEKPAVIPDGYEHNGNCLTNTFQFAVSKEAFKALSIVEPHLPAGEGKEPRDWSKCFVPILMGLSQHENSYDARQYIEEKLSLPECQIPISAIEEAKKILGNQKVIAVPTSEAWADCGTLNQLYHTTMQIASNDFPLEDFERKHVLDSINSNTGLIASTPEQKAEIEEKYDISGQVMVVPKVKYVHPRIIQEYKSKGLITVNPYRGNFVKKS